MNFSDKDITLEKCKVNLFAHMRSYGSAVSEALFEIFWPTRCSLCDVPGEYLCPRCRLSLSYIDPLHACKVCGSPWGNIQCCECNSFSLMTLERKALPFAQSRSAVVFDHGASRIVTLYKDQGEQSLAQTMACMMTDAIPPRWLSAHPSVAFVPATTEAKTRRGFDHSKLLASIIAEKNSIPLIDCFKRPQNKDQRKLSRSKRVMNMTGRVVLNGSSDIPDCILLVDDVYTTGSTLMTASDALIQAGAQEINCITFARVW